MQRAYIARENRSSSRLPVGVASSDLAAYTRDELEAMNRALVAVLEAGGLEDVVGRVFGSLASVCSARGCALYGSPRDGSDLRKIVVAGDAAGVLPDLIPGCSDLYEHIAADDAGDMCYANSEEHSHYSKTTPERFFNLFFAMNRLSAQLRQCILRTMERLYQPYCGRSLWQLNCSAGRMWMSECICAVRGAAKGIALRRLKVMQANLRQLIA